MIFIPVPALIPPPAIEFAVRPDIESDPVVRSVVIPSSPVICNASNIDLIFSGNKPREYFLAINKSVT